jgi:hypothetical protein
MGASFPLTFDATFEPQTAWWIDQQAVPVATDEVATHRTLTLTFRVTSRILTDVLRPLKSDQGKVDVLPSDDGGFTAVDRADGSNTYQLDPPDRRKPLRQAETYHVNRYEEELISQTVDEWTVEVEFTRGGNRTDTPSIGQALNGQAFPAVFDWTFGPRDAEWKLTTRYGDIVTNRVDAEFLGTGEGGVRRFELTTRLTDTQAHALEAALSQLSGTRVREIPDAPNQAVDDTPGETATVTVDSPDTQGTVTDGEYVATGFTSTRLSDAYQSVSLTIAERANA